LKILLFRSFGSHTFSKELKNILLRKKFPENRTGAIINHLEKQGEVVIREEGGYWIKAYDEFYFIAEVDTSRPWTILEYDGSEYIQYLDYKVIHKDLNYCKFIS
jgi:hypothetical protein